MDDATVEAIAAEMYAAAGGRQWEVNKRIWIEDARAFAPIFARYLPDPRPTEAEARKRWQEGYAHVEGMSTALALCRALGCFRPEPVPAAEPPDSIHTGPRLSLGEVAPGLVEGLQHLVDEYGQRGVEDVLAQWPPPVEGDE